MVKSQHSEVVDRVRDALAPQPSVREVKMFGGLSFMVGERMVLSVRGDGDLLIRADPELADELIAAEGAQPAEMGRGRPMNNGWISVAAEAVEAEDDLDFWIGVALEYHGSQKGSPIRDGRRNESR